MYDLIVKELPSVLKEADLGLVRLSNHRYRLVTDVEYRTHHECLSWDTLWVVSVYIRE